MAATLSVITVEHFIAWNVSKYGVFFWSVFSWIRTEYRDLFRKSPYSVRIQEKLRKKPHIWTLFTRVSQNETFHHQEHGY